MNTLPRPKIHKDKNARNRAYYDRQREQRSALAALATKVVSDGAHSEGHNKQLLEELPQEQRDIILRLASSQNNVTNLKISAG
jgi:hypothetical protein